MGGSGAPSSRRPRTAGPGWAHRPRRRRRPWCACSAGGAQARQVRGDCKTGATAGDARRDTGSLAFEIGRRRRPASSIRPDRGGPLTGPGGCTMYDETRKDLDPKIAADPDGTALENEEHGHEAIGAGAGALGGAAVGMAVGGPVGAVVGGG